MKVVVTGGAGFVGSWLVESLLSAGARVTAIDNLSTGLVSNLDAACRMAAGRNLEFVVDDCRHAVDHIKDADVVYHLAAVVGVERVMEAPRRVLVDMHESTRRVIEACTRLHKRLVMTSTSEVYGRNEQVPFREDQDCHVGPPTDPRSSYALVKLAEEFMALDAHRSRALPVTIVRLFNTVGPRQSGDYGMVMARFVEQALGGRKLTVHRPGTQRRCFTAVKDVVRCLMLLAQDGHEGQIFNVGSASNEVPITRLAMQIAAAVGRPLDIEYMPGRPSDMDRRVPDLSKLRAAIGYVPHTTLDEIIAELMA